VSIIPVIHYIKDIVYPWYWGSYLRCGEDCIKIGKQGNTWDNGDPWDNTTWDNS
jgi:hypothetical protein